MLSFFFNHTATTEIYTLSLHDALPISQGHAQLQSAGRQGCGFVCKTIWPGAGPVSRTDRKSTRLNSSHSQISYAVFCLKKKKIRHNSTKLVRIARLLITVSTPTNRH